MKQFRAAVLDEVLLAVLAGLLVLHYMHGLPGEYDASILFGVSLLATLPVLVGAARALLEWKVSVDLLASIALAASLLAHEWASAAFINLMLTSARLFGAYTESRARAAIKSILKLRPERVRIDRGGSIAEIPVAQVRVGDQVIVESGERIPIDGVIERGEASVDQSSLTGESVPVSKHPGDVVYSSTLAASGSLVVRTEKVGADTALEKLIALVEQSGQEKSGIRTTADRFAAWYIVAMLVLSALVYAATRNLPLLLSLLLVACADDIAVAIPMGFLAAMGYAARRGVIIKGAAFLEGLTKVKTIIMDKTGTLTRGKLAVSSVVPFPPHTEAQVLEAAALTEAFSDHPIAKAVRGYIEQHDVHPEKPADFEEFPGKGTVATHGGAELVSGKKEFLVERGVRFSEKEEQIVERARAEGFTTTLLARDTQPIGFIASADELRPHAKPVIEELKAHGVERIVMLTGDNEEVAARVAHTLGITETHANLLPEDKLTYIKKYLNPETKIAMVGDGVNDAAALSLADIGIAMGAIGSDTAIEAADIALMRDDLRELPEMMSLARYTVHIARQDFLIWGVVNAIGLVLVFGGVVGPEGAAAYNFVTDFFPLLNSLRLFNLHLHMDTRVPRMGTARRLQTEHSESIVRA